MGEPHPAADVRVVGLGVKSRERRAVLRPNPTARLAGGGGPRHDLFMPRTLLGVAALSPPWLSVVAPTRSPRHGRPAVAVTPADAGRRESPAGSSSLVQRTLAIRRTGVYDRATVAMVKRVQAWKQVTPANGIVGARPPGVLSTTPP